MNLQDLIKLKLDSESLDDLICEEFSKILIKLGFTADDGLTSDSDIFTYKMPCGYLLSVGLINRWGEFVPWWQINEVGTGNICMEDYINITDFQQEVEDAMKLTPNKSKITLAIEVDCWDKTLNLNGVVEVITPIIKDALSDMDVYNVNIQQTSTS